jgi:catechol 2,3-dioxygenase-like lactoylglutathione lyase family enzyme
MGIDHVAINVQNIAKSVEWYVDTFSAQVDYQDETWAMLKVGDSKLALTLKGHHPPHIAIEVGKFSDSDNIREHRDGSKYVYKSDPDGNIVELISYS